HHPDAFCCALLNSQPMGFYAPAQIVGDARKNKVEVREVDVSFSFAANTLEERSGKHCAVRLGFRQIDGFAWDDPDEERLKRLRPSFREMPSIESSLVEMLPPRARSTSPHRGEVGLRLALRSIGQCNPGEGAQVPRGTSPLTRVFDATSPYGRGEAPPTPLSDEIQINDWAARIVAARARGPFTSLEDFARDTGLPKRALVLLADADAFRSLGLDRRAALWAVRRLPDDVPLPLFEAATAREQPDENAKPLPLMPLPEQVVADYQTIRLSLKGHPMQFLRAMFSRERVAACHEVCK